MKYLFAFVLLAVATTGCSTIRNVLPAKTTSAGDQMLTQAKATSNLGKNWNDGQKLIEKGEKLKARSEKLALESQQAQIEADSLIAKGSSLVKSSESTYKVAFGSDDDPSTVAR